MSVQQFYCTHCTYGSSAFERNAGELAHRTLGYSARAGSQEGDALRQCYRQSERYVYYYPPRDVPGEAKLGLTAASAPQRLVCVPALGDRQMLAHVSYRPTDCEGRPGSYFAHVLLRDERDGQEPWSPLHCARLWGAPGWVQEDSPAIPHRLPPLGKLDDLLHGGPASIDDRVLVSFLSTPAGGAFNDPGGAIPPRWQRIDAALRRQAFTEAFDALIEIGTLGQPTLLLVIEPSLAALFFFGMLRLLPAGPLRDALSFSTFEPNPDQLCTTLAATWFFDPQRASVQADQYGVRGIVVNTLDNRPPQPPRRQSAFVHATIDRLLGAGWTAVDGTLADLQAVEARSIQNIERLTAVESMAQSLLAGRELLPGFDWRRSAQDVAYLRRSVARGLFARRDIAPALEKLIGRPAHPIVLELLMGEGDDSAAQPAVEYLLQRLPDEQFGALLRLGSVPPQLKLDVLVRYVAAHGMVPPGCEWLWEHGGVPPASPEHGRDGRGEPLLPLLLARLDPDTVERFCRNTAEQYRAAFLAAMLQARRLPGPGSKALSPVAGLLPPTALIDVYRIAGDEFFAQYPADEPTLGRKLHELLALLPEGGGTFSARLDVLLAAKDHLPSDRACRAVACWDACRRAVMELGTMQSQEGGASGAPVREPMEAACRNLAEAIAEALPDDAVGEEDEPVGADRLACLHAIGRSLLGKELLPAGIGGHDALWGKMAQYFENGQWPSMPIAKTVPQPPPPPPASRAFSAASHSHKPSATKTDASKGPYIIAALLVCVIFVVGALIFAASRGAGDRDTSDEEQNAVASSQFKSAEETRPAAKPEPLQKTAPAAKTVEQPPQKTNEEPPQKPVEEPKPTLDDERQWQTRARELAGQKQGILLAGCKLQDGAAAVSPDDIQRLAHPADLRLGIGRLYIEGRAFEFGQDFLNKGVVSRHRLPVEAAGKLGYPSVWVGVQKHEGGFRLIVEPRTEDGAELPDNDPDKRELQRQARERIAAQCRTISAVVYPAPAAPVEPKPEPPAAEPTVNDPHTQVAQLRPIAVPANREFIAKLVLQIRNEEGKVLPAFITKTFRAKCHGQFYLVGGKTQPFDVDLIAKAERDKGGAKGSLPPGTAKVDVPPDTERIGVQFAFYKEIDNVMTTELKRVAESGRFLFDVKAGTEYTIRHEVPARTIDELKLK